MQTLVLWALVGAVAFSHSASSLAPPPQKEVKKRDATEAALAVRVYFAAHKKALNPAAKLTMKDITPDDVWKRLSLQVVQGTSELLLGEAFVLRGDQVYPIGRAFGGHGINSLAVADLDKDGKLELVYAFSWGSGIHRSQLGLFDAAAKEPKEYLAPTAYFANDDWVVQRSDDQTVLVKAQGKTVGRLVLDGKEGARQYTLRLDDNVPAEIRKLIGRRE